MKRIFFLLLICINCPVFAQKIAISYENNRYALFDVSGMKEEQITVERFNGLSTHKKIQSLPAMMYRGNERCMTYYIDSFILVIRYCSISAHIGDKLLWMHGFTDCPTNCDDSAQCPTTSNFFVKEFSSDLKRVLLVDKNAPMFVSKRSCIEYDLLTGKQTGYGTKTDNPVYAPGCNYIIANHAFKKGIYFLFRCGTEKKEKKFKKVKEMFWVL